MPRNSKRTESTSSNSKPEVPLQITVPPKVKHAIDLMSVETGCTRRAIVLKALRHIGVDVADEDIAGRRGAKNK